MKTETFARECITEAQTFLTLQGEERREAQVNLIANSDKASQVLQLVAKYGGDLEKAKVAAAKAADSLGAPHTHTHHQGADGRKNDRQTAGEISETVSRFPRLSSELKGLAVELLVRELLSQKSRGGGAWVLASLAGIALDFPATWPDVRRLTAAA